VEDELVSYVRPQECGGHADVRSLSLHDAAGHGMRIELDTPSQVSALPIRPADLDATRHEADLVPCPETVIHLDAAHRGVGTASCGPDTLPQYLVRSGEHRWAWTIRVR
jgi:beta-galactosidase